jgi:hypothetical protein
MTSHRVALHRVLGEARMALDVHFDQPEAFRPIPAYETLGAQADDDDEITAGLDDAEAVGLWAYQRLRDEAIAGGHWHPPVAEPVS